MALSPTRAAVAAHLTPLTAALAAFASHDPFVRAHGRAALRFHVSLALYFAAMYGLLMAIKGSVVAVQVAPFMLFLNLVLVLNWILFTLVAIHRAATGQTFTYPMTLGRN
jgi:uncharacterized Tic20 family protein